MVLLTVAVALAAAKVWHYWLSWFLLGGVALLVVALGVGYYIRVMSMRPPRR